MELQLENHKKCIFFKVYHKIISILGKTVLLSLSRTKSVFNRPTSVSVFSYCFRPKYNIEILINCYLFIFVVIFLSPKMSFNHRKPIASIQLPLLGNLSMY